jgi:hypothetical protein
MTKLIVALRNFEKAHRKYFKTWVDSCLYVIKIKPVVAVGRLVVTAE